jgi:two-component system phosphate regulon response regulator PhoB
MPRQAVSKPHPAKPLVLVVEDEAALATMLRYNLEKQGFRVDEAADGQEALTRIAERSPTWCCWTGCCR